MNKSNLTLLKKKLCKLFALRVGSNGMTKDRVLNTLKQYGFVEISDLINYVYGINGKYIDAMDAKYICERVRYCLERHGSDGDYFTPLKNLVSALQAG